MLPDARHLPLSKDWPPMAQVTCDIGMSVDGFVAGPDQAADAPFGTGVRGRMHRWMFGAPDENAAEIEAMNSAGAYVMGRNMFGPDRGEWDLDWQGWWGPEPPYRAPVFILCHRERESLEMEGGTTFTFVTDGIESALEQARASAGDRHVAIAGGAATVNQYLVAGLIDELRLHIAPFVLGEGERLFDGVADADMEPLSVRSNELVTHVNYRIR